MKTKKQKKIEFMALLVGDRSYGLFDPVTVKRDDVPRIEEFIAGWSDTEVIVTIEADVTRSSAQNRFFHGCILPAVKRTLAFKGMPMADNTEFVKEVILKKPYLTVNHGTPNEYIRSTASLTVEEFWLFCEFCLELLIQLGGSLTDREQLEYQKIVSRYHVGKAIDQHLAREN